ncbi:hypothetical protein IEQ34_020694 [Dendrobium chrysotoxum]|uniref:Uncharacterized protein n=1 Tax=Dendrobium chrysotoxum TaxID=161865 RepID=A0AAV7G3I2_DENCH|nr:hypothetical protein IEQ34_020694 [Dendrobium chrysotoxum]
MRISYLSWALTSSSSRVVLCMGGSPLASGWTNAHPEKKIKRLLYSSKAEAIKLSESPVPVLKPYEARSTVIAEFLNIFQGKKTLWKAELFEQFNGLLPADFIALKDLSALPVAVYYLRSHYLR